MKTFIVISVMCIASTVLAEDWNAYRERIRAGSELAKNQFLLAIEKADINKLTDPQLKAIKRLTSRLKKIEKMTFKPKDFAIEIAQQERGYMFRAEFIKDWSKYNDTKYLQEKTDFICFESVESCYQGLITLCNQYVKPRMANVQRDELSRLTALYAGTICISLSDWGQTDYLDVNYYFSFERKASKALNALKYRSVNVNELTDNGRHAELVDTVRQHMIDSHETQIRKIRLIRINEILAAHKKRKSK